MSIKLRDIDKDELRKVLNNIGVRSLNRLLEEIGLGLRVGNIVAQQITGFLKENHSVEQKEVVPLEITGSEGLIVNYAVCCKPIPGDSVIGHFTAERGLVIHQERCKNILSVREDPQQCFPVNWGEPSGRSFTAQIKVVARDEPGLLANLASVITNQETNIASIQTMEINTGMHEFILDLEVSDRLHLSRILRKIRTLNNIVSVTRIHDWEMRQATAMH
jgi:(p)ppGpp synthase/HD superfamily hydrolase